MGDDHRVASAFPVARRLHWGAIMNIDIHTEHVAMRPEWQKMIETWLDHCRWRHPDVQGIDVRLRHADEGRTAETVNVVALARGRSLRAGTRSTTMSTALYDALETLERELVLNEAIRPRLDRVQ